MENAPGTGRPVIMKKAISPLAWLRSNFTKFSGVVEKYDVNLFVSLFLSWFPRLVCGKV